MDVYNLSEMWGALALRGMVAIFFGVVAVFWPGLTIITLLYLFAAYAIVTGLINEIIGLVNVGHSGRSFWARILLILLGMAQIGVGVYLFRHPHATFNTFIVLIGLTLIVTALVDLFAGAFGDQESGHRAVLFLTGLVSGIAGVIMLFQPAKSGVAFVWVLGIYALITGPLLLALAYEAKRILGVLSAPAPVAPRTRRTAR
ncbi:MAG TPA: DUF308 domain-containing protein [Candidatus Saccharimonadales bacterium]|nr:DUF308 domain-containing protein [Candidatus Saccharimonadales bacterium]